LKNTLEHSGRNARYLAIRTGRTAWGRSGIGEKRQQQHWPPPAVSNLSSDGRKRVCWLVRRELICRHFKLGTSGPPFTRPRPRRTLRREIRQLRGCGDQTRPARHYTVKAEVWRREKEGGGEGRGSEREREREKLALFFIPPVDCRALDQAEAKKRRIR
jgi:hypothetical protein